MQKGFGLTHAQCLHCQLCSLIGATIMHNTEQKDLTGQISHGPWDSFDVIFDELFSSV